ncbi:MAG: PQQ-binding-like beta-propeller repeat protein [Planctomycetota bacterium]
MDKRNVMFWSMALLLTAASELNADDWQQASGPNGNFVVAGEAPDQFSVFQNENVLWRTPLPSTGQGTVIVCGGKAFVTSHEEIAEDTEMGRDILGMCFDAHTGKELWRKTVAGTRVTDLSSLFSDNTAASPVADKSRVCFVNVGGQICCFDHEGQELWSYDWVPFGRHHARLHEPILHDGKVITVQYPKQDLELEHTTKPGAKLLGRDRKYWTRLQAFDLKTGKRKWISDAGTSIHQTSTIGNTKRPAILTGRGGGHQPPEEPYGLSFIDASDGREIWETAIKGYPSAQNACWNTNHAFALTHKEHLKLDLKDGTVLNRISLLKDVSLTRHDGASWVREAVANLPNAKQGFTKNSNVLVGDYHYFRSASRYLIGRVHVGTGKVEYLQVPVQVVVESRGERTWLWEKPIKNDMKNANGFVASQDRRNAGDGWGHVSAASPIVVGDKIYLPTMLGVVYVLRWNAELLDEQALLSVSDLGPAGETWTLASLSYARGRLYARTLKELICIGN